MHPKDFDLGLTQKFVAATLAAEDALARLDERLATSPIRDGWIARTHFSDACACIWADGDLVMVEDLVLHDAAMDIRTPSHELVRAQDFLRARRRIAAAPPGWSLTAAGLNALRGVKNPSDVRSDAPPAARNQAGRLEPDAIEVEDALAAELAAIDALIARSSKVLAGDPSDSTPAPAPRTPLIYGEEFDEDARLKEWRALVEATRDLPPVFAAALAADAWTKLAPLEHQAWLGRMIIPDFLRARQKTRHHLLCLNVGLKTVPRERRHSLDRDKRLLGWICAIGEAAELGLRDHDRWSLARTSLQQRLVGRRKNSKLPQLIDLVMRRPIASAALIAAELDVTPRAAQNLVRDLGLREATGRGRYRAWGIL